MVWAWTFSILQVQYKTNYLLRDGVYANNSNSSRYLYMRKDDVNQVVSRKSKPKPVKREVLKQQTAMAIPLST